MAGAHTSEKRWYRNQNPNGNESVAEVVQLAARNIITSLNAGEEMFQEMLEMNAFVGGTNQLLANQLFKEIIAARTVPGTNAVVVVDVVSGAITNPVILTAGTGYTTATGLTRLLTVAAGGGDGLAELTYDVVNGGVANVSVSVAGSTYTNGLAQAVTEFPAPTLTVPDTAANAQELGMIVDLVAAVTAIHDLYQAMTNVAIPQEDRLAQLRRMS